MLKAMIGWSCNFRAKPNIFEHTKSQGTYVRDIQQL